MRVSEQQRYATVNERIEKAKNQNEQTLEVLSSQKKINALHDDPIGHARVVRYNDRIKDMQNYTKNIIFSKGYLDVTESAVSSIADKLIRARELAIGMANDTYDANSRSAAGREIKQIINEVIQLGNTTYSDRYVFSGFRTDTPAISRDGEFLGDDGAIYLQVEANNFRQINVPGRELFEAAPTEAGKKGRHFNLVASLQLLNDGLDSDDKHMIYTSIDELGHQLEKTTSYQASLGAIYGALDQVERRLEVNSTKTKEAKSRVEDADMFQSSSDFKKTEAILQSTLMASNKLLQPSLMNFMQ